MPRNLGADEIEVVGECVHQSFEAHAARTPGAPALVFEDQQLTYGELDAGANRLARCLRDLGVGVEDRVALYLDRSVESVVALVAALKSGGAFVPIDVANPRERLAFLFDDARPRVAITTSARADRVPGGVPHVLALDRDRARIDRYDSTPLGATATSANLAYQMYTSGSTGRPKGVLVEHAQVVSYASAIARRLPMEDGDRFGLVSSFSTDSGYTAIFGALCTGRCLVVTPRTGMDAESLADYFRQRPIDFLKIAPTHLRAVLPSPGARYVLPRKALVVGGESLTWDLVERVRRLAPSLAIYNHYGPTETTVGVATCVVDDRLERRDAGVPLGKPLGHAKIYVLTRNMQLAPIGVKGEIHIGGAGVARGYANQPEDTAERFVHDPFSARAEDRLYRTGDMGRILADGNLEFLGRLDGQVKIRGFRVEPAEVEAALARHPAVRQAAVVATEDAIAGNRLAAYVVLHAAGTVPAAELRRFAGDHLPDYMVPSTITMLDQLPLSASGKIERSALPPPAAQDDEPASAYVAPRTPVEQTLAEIWKETLGAARVGAHDTFLDLGGDSIQAIQLVARATQAGLPLKLDDLFAGLDLATLAAELTAVDPPQQRPGTAPAPRATRDLRDLAGHIADLDQIEDAYPLSPMQQAMLLHSVSISTAGEYLEQKRVRLPRSLNVAAFEQAWRRTVARNPILRTAFVWEGLPEPLQVVYRSAEIPLAQRDLRGLSPAEQSARISELIQAERREPRADLSRLPLTRLTLFRLADDSFELLWAHHNALLDGWAADLVLREVKALYEHPIGAGAAEPPPNRPYRDFLDWLDAQAPRDAEAFWRLKLAGETAHGLPSVEPEAATPGAPFHDGYAQKPWRLSAASTAELREFARQHQLTLHTVVMGVWALLLHIYSRGNEVVFGSVLSGRDAGLADADAIAGPLINVVPVRVSVPADQRATAWLQQLQASHFETRRFGHSPLSLITEWSGLAPGQFLFNSILVFNNHPLLDEADWSIRNVSSQQTGYPVHVVVEPGREIAVLCTHRLSHCGHAATSRLLGHFGNLLTSLAANPAAKLSELPLLAPEESQGVLATLGGLTVSYPLDRTFAQLFEAQAARTPDAVAIRAAGVEWTYKKLNDAANAVARYLLDQEVGTHAIVGILANRGPLLVAAMLGAFKARTTCLPLDPRHPAGRVSLIVSSARAAVLLCGRDLADTAAQAIEGLPLDQQPEVAAIDALLESQPAADIPARGRPDDPAYVIFTSGSTGRPKGAIVEQRGMVNHLFGKIDALGLGSSDRLAQTAPVSFDIFVWQFLAPLLAGATVCVFDDETILDPLRMLARVDEEQVSVLEIVPSVLRLLLEELQRPAARLPRLALLRWLILTGESLPADLCRSWLSLYPRVPLLNAYGPTECSDDVTHHAIEAPPAAHVRYAPIGRALPNVRLYIVDADLRLLPAGVAGELCVGGVCVGRGYLNDPERTAEAFLRDPFAGPSDQRLYRTGDLVRLLPGGALEFLGRSDNQVKINGVRIELGEIEATLRQHPAVTDAVVVIDQQRPAHLRLAVYVVPNERLSLTPAELRYILGKMLPDYAVPPIFSLLDTMPDQQMSLTPQDLRYHLAKTMPDYMVPSSILFLKQIPLSPNGKVDRQRLPPLEGDAERAAAAGSALAPRTPTEQALAELWSNLLGISEFSIEDNFFRLGGNSLRATQMILRVREQLQVELPIHAIFESPTIAGLAQKIDSSRFGRQASV